MTMRDSISDTADDSAAPDPWFPLRALTPARIALGRAGGSLPTRPLLEFQLAHAQARDAVHVPFDADGVARRLQERGWEVLRGRSRALDRGTYLRRPDLGRRLDDASRRALEIHAAGDAAGFDAVFVIADGLSAPAAERHAPPMLERVRERLAGWRIAPAVVVEGGRVALGDEIGEILGARLAVVLIGERPGLSSPDSLGIYLTWGPRIGRTDAERNCISNVRPEGLPYEEAARKLAHLMRQARKAAVTGVRLKDDSDVMMLEEGMRTDDG